MIEYNVACIKSRKSIEIATYHGICILMYIFSYIQISACCRNGIFKCHKKRHHKRDRTLGKKSGQPKEWASPKIKCKISEHCSAKIDIPVPKELSASYGSVRNNVKRNLLYIIITVIEKRHSSLDKNRKYSDHIHKVCTKEHYHRYIPAFFRNFLLSICSIQTSFQNNLLYNKNYST